MGVEKEREGVTVETKQTDCVSWQSYELAERKKYIIYIHIYIHICVYSNNKKSIFTSNTHLNALFFFYAYAYCFFFGAPAFGFTQL